MYQMMYSSTDPSESESNESLSTQTDNTIYPWNWDALSYVITPVQLKVQLLRCTQLSLQYFKAHKGTIFVRMFYTMSRRLEAQHKSGTGSLDIFLHLAQEGFIPPTLPSHTVSNDRFGYLSYNKEWKEWPIVSPTLMRLYWCSMFQDISNKQVQVLEKLCNFILHFLPGQDRTCAHCKWILSEFDFFDDHTCNYCHESIKNPTLHLRRKGKVTFFSHKEYSTLHEKMSQLSLYSRQKIPRCSEEFKESDHYLMYPFSHLSL